MAPERIRFDTFELDLKTGELHKQSRRVRLQDQPARLLILLASHPGELVTREEIHRTLWEDGEFVEFEHAVNTAVRKIRSALDDDPDSPRIIETLPRKGYRFIAAVEFIAPAEAIEPIVVSPVTVEELPQPAMEPATDFILPVSASGSRALFLLAQIPYVVTYLVVLYHWYDLEVALRRTFAFIPIGVSLPALQVLALLGFTIRVYLISLVGWGHSDAGPRFRKLFPWLLPLDALWAATPLLAEHSLGPLVSWTGLILMGWLIFGQRTLMRSIEQSR